MNKETHTPIGQVMLPEYFPAQHLHSGDFDFDNPESNSYVEPGDSATMLRKVTELYFGDRPQDLQKARERLTALRARDQAALSAVPEATVVIATIEDSQTLSHTVEQLKRQDGIEQCEIMLYGNVPVSYSQEQKQEKRRTLDTVTAQFPQLQLRSILAEYDWSETDDVPLMGKIRSDYLDIVALDAAERGFGVDHPVIVFDADTRMITQGSVAELIKGLTHPSSRNSMVHLETSYLPDGQDGPLSDPMKLVILQEIRRRQWMRIRANERKARGASFRMTYDEEWGTAIALGPCLTVGSYNEHGRINENLDLKNRIIWGRDAITAIMRHAKPDIVRGMDYRTRYIPGKVVRGSGRRQEDFFKRWIAEPAGTDLDQMYQFQAERYFYDGLSYATFSHDDAARKKSAETVRFRDKDQACRMIGAVLSVNSVICDGYELALPDAGNVLRCLGLPN